MTHGGGWLAVDDVGDLLLVVPAKADGGSGGPMVWLVGWVEDRWDGLSYWKFFFF